MDGGVTTERTCLCSAKQCNAVQSITLKDSRLIQAQTFCMIYIQSKLYQTVFLLLRNVSYNIARTSMSWDIASPTQGNLVCLIKPLIFVSKITKDLMDKNKAISGRISWTGSRRISWTGSRSRVEICRDRSNRRSCKVFVSCVNFSRKLCSFFHTL